MLLAKKMPYFRFKSFEVEADGFYFSSSAKERHPHSPINRKMFYQNED